ncbi:MAG: S41 family peptidase [Betaproteobacteria bacterium]|nr:S41 family peptidase [Betaproteobacteria bacterium]
MQRPAEVRPIRRVAINALSALALVLVSTGHATFAQTLTRVDAAMRKQVVEAAIREMNDRYVFPDQAKQLEQVLRQKLAAKAYDGDDLADAKAFAARLTQDIQASTRDKHIRVRHSDTVLPPMRERDPTPAEIEDMRKRGAALNFGLERIERLRFNIGYLDLRGFQPAAFAGHKIAAAMTLLSDTNALIIDLRQNGGGDPATVQLISSYLFDVPTHLNNMYYRDGDRTTQAWTHGWVPGERFGQAKPVYVLTARRTFSAAEEFSYNLKNLKRATLVGETTGGGAHPGGMRRLNDHFAMFVSNGRAINPISKTNWEGVGVEPDVKVDAADALRVARLDILRKLDTSKEDDAYRKQLAEHIAEVEKDGKHK